MYILLLLFLKWYILLIWHLIIDFFITMTWYAHLVLNKIARKQSLHEIKTILSSFHHYIFIFFLMIYYFYFLFSLSFFLNPNKTLKYQIYIWLRPLCLCCQKSIRWFSTSLGNVHYDCCYCIGTTCKLLFFSFLSSLDSFSF